MVGVEKKFREERGHWDEHLSTMKSRERYGRPDGSLHDEKKFSWWEPVSTKKGMEEPVRAINSFGGNDRAVDSFGCRGHGGVNKLGGGDSPTTPVTIQPPYKS